MTMTGWTLLGLGYLLGALSVFAVEVVGFAILLRRLNRRIAHVKDKLNEPPKSLSPDFGPSFCNKQGVVWILEPEKIKSGSLDCEQRELKRKSEIVEVFPAQKNARIRNHSLFILEPDGCHAEIPLASCMVEAVSATSSPSRKWAKRYPIKIESKESNLYKGNKTLYMYLETRLDKIGSSRIGFPGREGHNFLDKCHGGSPIRLARRFCGPWEAIEPLWG